MNEVFPLVFRDFYEGIAPAMKWLCFATDLYGVLMMYALCQLNMRHINHLLRLFLYGIMLQEGTRMGAILLQADILITPFTLLGSLCLAGACTISALGKTGLRETPNPILKVSVHEFKLRKQEKRQVN